MWSFHNLFTLHDKIFMYMDTLMNSLFTRRSIRKYSPEPLSEELLNELLTAGCRSSNTGNMQAYSIIVTREQSIKMELFPLHFNQSMITDAPVVLTFCADFNRFSKWCEFRKAEPGYDNFLSLMSAAIDAIIAAQTVCIAAEAKGLGICYLGTTTYMARGIIDVLKLPRGVVPVATVTAGWPDEDPDQPDRLPLEAIVHNEVYKDYTEADIDNFYSEKEGRDDSKQFVNENGKETLAQVFTDVRYTKADNIAFSKSLLQVLSDQGFMNQ